VDFTFNVDQRSSKKVGLRQRSGFQEVKTSRLQAGHVAVVRTTQSGERLRPLAQLELVEGQPNKGAGMIVFPQDARGFLA